MKVLILSVIPIAAFVIGSWVAKRNARPPRDEHKELVKLRTLVGNLRAKAAEHAVLGDDFAVIALGMISETEANS